MSFVNAIKSGFRNYINFKGRASRAQYWWWTLFSVIVNFALPSDGGLNSIASAVILLPTIAITIRRMHDTDHVGWWMLFPIVNIVLSLRRGTLNENRFLFLSISNFSPSTELNLIEITCSKSDVFLFQKNYQQEILFYHITLLNLQIDMLYSLT